MGKPPFDPSSRNFPYFMTSLRGRRGRRRPAGMFESLVTLVVALVMLGFIVTFLIASLFH
ncbi:hypothetical protein EPN52_02415 [bacterium]|nr:MAG: hypothetical protein EPN52_02415 [bacterium]